MTKKIKKVFQQGPISASFIAGSIAKHQSKTSIGAHSIFMGQVRADEINGKTVKAIDYSAYEEMAEKEFQVLREETFEKFNLSCMHIHHSLGRVMSGEICLFVFVSSKHRTPVFGAIEYLVEEIKKRIAIFGKEIFEDESHSWKINN